MMKMLRVIPSMNSSTGGPSEGIRNSVRALAQLGVTTDVVSLDDPMPKFEVSGLANIHQLGPHSTPWQYSSKLLPWLESNISDFDIVIIHGLWLYHSYAVLKALEKLKMRKGPIPKVFVMPHGMLDPYFQSAKNRRLKAVRNLLYWHLVEKRVVNHSDGIFFTSDQEMLRARTTFNGYHPKKEFNIGYGIIDPPKMTASSKNSFLKQFPLLENSELILFIGRIHEKKGVDLLIKAFIEETKHQFNKPILIIAGPGQESEFGCMIKQEAAQNSNIVFTGMLRGDNKWGAFDLCTSFILPSHQENFGIAVVEALAYGKAVLISNKVNIYQDILDDNAGFAAEDTYEGTRELLRIWYAMSSSQRVEMSKNARLCFENRYSLKTGANKLLQILEAEANKYA